MECKLTLSVFRFDARTDYLAYQKKIVLSVDEEASVADVLQTIKDDEKDFGFPTDANAAIKINGAFLFTKTKIKKIIKDFGKELTLEPISARRAVKDLLINDEDFQTRFDLLDAYVDAADKKRYKKLIREYYASDILKYNDDYFGDALFAFAFEMIEKHPQRQRNILEIINDPDNGIWQHINITNKLYPFDNSLEEKIDSLKNKIIKELPSSNSFVAQQTKLASVQ